MTHNLESYEPSFTRTADDYRPFIGSVRVEQLKRLAGACEGRSWVSVNSTLQGGGVAEKLRSVVPLARGLGIDAHWCAIKGRPEFFQITKKFHNLLQGVERPISLEEIFGEYLDTIEQNAENAYISSDMIVLHDPQPLALTAAGVLSGHVIWRCHIDTSEPNRLLWRALLPYINQCAGAVFTQPEFVGQGVRKPVYEIAPCIDPLAEKNHDYSDREALDILTPLFNEHNIDPDRPILAAVSRYDIHKNQATIIKAFKRLREERTYAEPPYLIFLGNTASDDPEGGAMLESLQQEAGDDPDIRFLVNVANNDQVVGALAHLARVFVHISTREGFGLVVSEALWQGTPVIGSTAGGIPKQVVDGVNGYLVEPKDVNGVARLMARFLDDPDEAAALGERGREHVRDHFLMPELVSRYLTLLRHYVSEDHEPPHFLINMNGNGRSRPNGRVVARVAGQSPSNGAVKRHAEESLSDKSGSRPIQTQR